MSGNHDKLLRTDLELFNSGLAVPLGLAPAIENGVNLIERNAGPVPVLWMVVEANVYASRQLTINLRAKQHLARGKITTGTLRKIKGSLGRLRAAKGKALRVLVLHYAPDMGRATAMSAEAMAFNYVLPHQCDGIDDLFQTLGGDAIDFVVHGHLHVPRLYNFKGVPIVSVGSLSQKGNDMNAFHVIKIMSSGQVRAEHHLWTGSGFKLDKDDSRSGPL